MAVWLKLSGVLKTREHETICYYIAAEFTRRSALGFEDKTVKALTRSTFSTRMAISSGV